jgi:beta-glucuronidase
MDKDTITNKIGFRTISTHGEDILLNGKPIFMRSVSFHEEIASECRRAYSREDAQKLLNEVKKLGCNMVRLAHYPQNENIIRKAEEMGIILWEEVPVWQSIDFSNNETLIKALKMLEEMICRDINRCSICFWGLSNETKPSVARNNFLQSMIDMTRRLDKTRLIASAFDVAYYNPDKEKFVIDDKFIDSFDVVGINKYMGWYAPWPRPAEEIAWDVARGHPLIITEFGGEALQGNYGHEDWASSWSEDYQAELYKKNIRMFKNIPNLRGVSPWVLYDFRSPFRFLPGKQDGWNRKGLLSDKGQKKKAWSIIHDYYLELKNTNE